MDRESKTNKAFAESEDSKYYARLFRDAITIPFALTSETHEALSGMYKPRIIRAGTARPPCGTHAIAAAHQRIAQKEAYEFARNCPSLIEIGPNAANMAQIAIGNPNVHGCTLFSARDQSRHQNSAQSATLRGYLPSKTQNEAIIQTGFDRHAYHEKVCALASGLPTSTFCVNGWQNCDFQASSAISCHGLYDISLLQLAIGMREHNTHHIRAWMHFPVQALEVPAWTDYERGYRFKTRTHEGREVIDFTWSDTAFGYTHDKTNWLAYLLVGAFDTPFGFSIIIEKTAVHGSQFTLDIHRVSSAGSFFYNIENSLVGLCKVPNFRLIAAGGFCKKKQIPYIITDTEKVKKAFQFIHARADKGFTHETVKAYTRTLIYETRLGSRIIEARWHCSVEEYSDLCLSIFILALYRRMVDAEVIRAAVEHLATLGSTHGITKRFLKWLRTSLHLPHNHASNHLLDTEENFEGQRILNIRTEFQDNNIFKMASIEFFDHYDQHDSIRDHDYVSEVVFPFNPDYVEQEPELRPTLEEIAAATPLPDLDEHVYNAWGLDLSIKACLAPVEVHKDYISEEQHTNLILETARGAAAAEAEDKKGLATSLTLANNEFRSYRPNKLNTHNMIALTGCFGSGKTGRILQDVIPAVAAKQGHVLVLCPTRALADKYSQDLQAPHQAATIHSGLRFIKKNKPTLIIVEEAFTLPMAYINFIAESHKVLIVGDKQQITHVDFSGLWKGCTKLEDYIGYIPTEHINITKRSPQDIANLPIIKSAYPGITSVSKKIVSMQHVPNTFVNPSANIICFTQSQKAILSNTYKQVASTVHEVQGQTFPSVILHYAGTKEERELISKSKNHLIVGLTRHTNNIFIRDLTDDHELMTFVNDSSPLSHIADESGIDLQASDSSAPTKPVYSIDTKITSDREYPFTKSEATCTEVILHKYYPAPPQREHVAQISTDLPLGEDLNGVLRINETAAEELAESKTRKIFRFPGPQRVMITRPTSKHLHVRSNLERLAHRTTNLPADQTNLIAERLFLQSSKEFDWNVSPQDKHTCFIEALKKMESRGHGMDKFKDIQDWNDLNVKLVKSFLKSQQKQTLGKDPLEADKAGQGISAWDKTLNTMMCAWTRVLEIVLVKQGKGRVKITTGMTDLEVMKILEEDGRPDDKFLDNDWTQFDSRQNRLTIRLLILALSEIGCPQLLLDEFHKMLLSRRICSEALSMLVHDKKDSGAPHTLIDNCWFNLNICLDLMADFRVLYIKGDDSLARGKDVKFDFDKMSFYGEKCGFRFKPNNSHSGNFVSFLINRYGVAFDLPRIAAKVLSRCYTNPEDYSNYQEAISATLMHVHEHEGHTMNLVNAYHLNQNDPHSATSDFDIILSFLKRFARKEIPFNQLIQSEYLTKKVDSSSLISNHFIDNSHIEKVPYQYTTHGAPIKAKPTGYKRFCSLLKRGY
nr:MAG: RNA-dependent RNA polymerase [Chemarfal virus 142]